MKRILTFSILLAVSALSAFELGKPCTIYFAPRCRAAAEDLAAIMSKVYSQNFPVKAAGKLNTGIFVGVKTPSKLVEAEVKGNRLDIYGNNVNFAVSDFLERECGVRFLWPGELGTVIPNGKVKAIGTPAVSFYSQSQNEYYVGIYRKNHQDNARRLAGLKKKR